MVRLGVGLLPFLEFSMLPGGYDFTHLVFWPIVALVAVATNLMPIILSAGIGILLFESIKGK